MKQTDYSKIAEKYDANPVRTDLSREPVIGNILSKKTGPISLLDLACGTGNFLQKQHEEYKGDMINWYGCDLSKEMLERANAKAPFAQLSISDAATLPYPDALFDIITCDFAFHHFIDKDSCVKEICRTLKPDGVIKMTNICPEFMQSSWIYNYFPSTKAIDRKRFWNNKRLFIAFQRRGFLVETETTIRRKRFILPDLVAEALNRDMSQLNLINDAEYQRGIEMMRADETKHGEYLGEFSLVRLVAQKQREECTA
jgi:ubiquinone/menaquinone biosynthesis C-methylase UbiE